MNEEALHEVFDKYSNVTDVSIKKLVCDEVNCYSFCLSLVYLFIYFFNFYFIF